MVFCDTLFCDRDLWNFIGEVYEGERMDFLKSRQNMHIICASR